MADEDVFVLQVDGPLLVKPYILTAAFFLAPYIIIIPLINISAYFKIQMAGGLFPSIPLYRDFYERRFVVSKCSFAYLFMIAISILCVLLPFVLTFTTGSKFWKYSF